MKFINIPEQIDFFPNFWYNIANLSFINQETAYYLRSYLVLLIVAIISATPLLKTIISKINNTKYKNIIDILEPLTYIALLILSTAFLIDESFNPFLYFRF